MYTLDGRQKKALHAALLAAFPRQAALERLVEFHLDTHLAVVAGEGPLADVVFRLMEWAEAQGRLDALVNGARGENPQNPQLVAFERTVIEARDAHPQDPSLRQFAERVQLAPAVPADAELEKRVFRAGFSDVAQWRARLGQAELAVCRIEAPAWQALGTGFLVGPDLVMTNRHVVDALVGQPSPSLVARFDFKVSPDGAHLREGVTTGLATDWLLASSPIGELDFAVLRLAQPAGLMPAGGTTGAPPRGWLTPAWREIEPDETVFVIQHPLGDALKLAAGHYEKREPRRLRYRVDTEPGSSGSPCFTAQLELVALHRGAAEGDANQGVPFDDILQALPPSVRSVLGTAPPSSVASDDRPSHANGADALARPESMTSSVSVPSTVRRPRWLVTAAALVAVMLTGAVAWWRPWDVADPSTSTRPTSGPSMGTPASRAERVAFTWERLQDTRGGCESAGAVTRALYRGTSRGSWPGSGSRAREMQLVAFRDELALEAVDAAAADGRSALAVAGTGGDRAVFRKLQFQSDVTVPVVVIACVRTTGEPPVQPPFEVTTWREASP